MRARLVLISFGAAVLLIGCGTQGPSPAKEPPPSLQKNNTWYHQRDDADTVVVFIHGIFSSSSTCWLSPTTKAYWPEIIKEDRAFPKCAIFTGGYYTATDSGTFDTQNAMEQLNVYFNDRTSGKTPLDFKNIIFIAHSTGGIVVREYLTRYQEHFKEKKVGLILLASPALGSHYADWLSVVAEAANNRMAKELRKTNPNIQNLDKRFRELTEKGDRCGFCLLGREFIENSFVSGGPLKAQMESIVSESDVGQYFGKSYMIPNTDHFSIAAPNSIGDDGHIYIREWVTNEFESNRCAFDQNVRMDRLRSNLKALGVTLSKASAVDLRSGSPEAPVASKALDLSLDESSHLFESIEADVSALRNVTLSKGDSTICKLAESLLQVRMNGLGGELPTTEVALEEFTTQAKTELDIAYAAKLYIGLNLERTEKWKMAADIYGKALETWPDDLVLSIRRFTALTAESQRLLQSGDEEKQRTGKLLAREAQGLYEFALPKISGITDCSFSAEIDDRGLPKGWNLWRTTPKGVFKIQVSKSPDSNVNDQVLQLETDTSSYAVFRQTRFECHKYPILTWSWMVEVLPEHGDCRHRNTDDQAAQVVVTFSSRSSPKIFMLQYCWDSNAPAGETVHYLEPSDEIPIAEMRYLVLRTGSEKLREWIPESRDIVKDLCDVAEKLKLTDFGKADVDRGDIEVTAVAVQSNSQRTKAKAVASFRSIRFWTRELAPTR